MTVVPNAGMWIRDERKKRYLSQAKMARLTNIAQAVLSQWELGKETPLEDDIHNIKAFFKRFDVEVAAGKINLKKRRYSREYSLSADMSLRTSNGNSGNGNGTYAKSVTTDRCLPSIAINGQVITPDIIRSKIDNGVDDGRPKSVALFAGIGGMSLGFKQAGFNVLGHVELSDASRRIYEVNFPGSICFGHDILKVSGDEIRRWRQAFGHVDVLFGGPPCQGFSLAGKRDYYDPRNQLYNEFLRVASILQPDIIVMENVRLLTSMKAPDGTKIPESVLAALNTAGYRAAYQGLNAQDYGVPQFRERVFFIGVRKDLVNVRVVFPKAIHGAVTGQGLPDDKLLLPYRTFRDATGNLERLESGESSKTDRWHFAPTHPDHVIQWLKNVPEGESAHNNPDPKMRPSSGYNTTYKRIKWDEPCSTISTNFGMISGSRNVHPTSTRAFTIREAMRCQTFPDDFKLVGSLGDIRTGIGNAVPPLLAKVIANHVKTNLLHQTLANLERLADECAC